MYIEVGNESQKVWNNEKRGENSESMFLLRRGWWESGEGRGDENHERAKWSAAWLAIYAVQTLFWSLILLHRVSLN